ncbi:hypothetical protein [Rhodococcus koreensis]|uniref:hypothetical protein n=1 Tax=Rhodococcus koreensis TaxID=99653 RepID=UPI00197DA764|nr:hypothetical protein [Rhodococcus koreensis]QSE85537.1 hypothetical protein JWS14_01805 [Rhodococcus koreensis]
MGPKFRITADQDIVIDRRATGCRHAVWCSSVAGLEDSRIAHVLVSEFLACGCVVWTQGARTTGNDLTLLHERALLDMAAGHVILRQHGFDAVVAGGRAGGGTSGGKTRWTRAGHSIELHHGARAYVLRQLVFVEECLAP